MKKKWFCRPKRTLRLSSRIAAALALAVASLVAAGEAAWSSTPAWVRSAADVALPKYPADTKAVLLLHEQATTVGTNGDVITRYRWAYRILRPEGRSFGTVSVEYDSETSLNYLRAWCIPPDGKDYEAKEKDALESSLSLDSLYADVRRKVLTIPGSEPGSVVAYEYEQKRRPRVPQDVWWFQDEVPVRQARYQLVLPASWEYHSFWLNSSPRKPEQTGNNAWTWEVSDVPPVEEESAMPAWEALAGRMGVTYYSPGATPGESHASWKDIGAWYSQLASAQRQDTAASRQTVAELTAGQKEAWEKVEALARFVQSNIRYVAIEIGPGGYQPHAAQVTFTNRYGDCKDKATLLAAMLGVIGVKSWYVLVNSRRGVVKPEFPTMLGFDHVILAIQVPDAQQPSLWAREDHKQLGPILYFDPTDPFVPMGYLPESLQNR
jgi:transglutaminase-like putative cysteine protease